MQIINNQSQVSQPVWKVLLLDWFASFLGVLVHVDGMPFGSSRNLDFSQYETQE